MMKIVRFQWQGRVSWGIVEEGGRIFALEGDVYGRFKKGKEMCRVRMSGYWLRLIPRSWSPAR